MSLRDVRSTEALKDLLLSVGRMPEEAMLVTLQVSLESLGSSVFDRTMVGICYSRDCRILCAMEVGMGVFGMLAVHLASVLAMRRVRRLPGCLWAWLR